MNTKKKVLLGVMLVMANLILAQKKPLDHSVYDSWQNLGERKISQDGSLMVYSINVQEGDNLLYIQQTNGQMLQVIPRGYDATISQDSKTVVCKIKATFQEIRNAKIKKKKAEELPKDSLAIFQIGGQSLIKIPQVKSYLFPEKNSRYLVYLLEKNKPDNSKATTNSIIDSTKKVAQLTQYIDSLLKVADSLKTTLRNIQQVGFAADSKSKAKEISANAKEDVDFEEGTDLIIKDLRLGSERKFTYVSEYQMDKSATNVAIEISRKKNDKNSKAMVLVHHLLNAQTDTILQQFNDAKSYVFDEEGKQMAFVAERDSARKESQKFYHLYYYNGKDSAQKIADRFSRGLPPNWTISDNGGLGFSKSGKRLMLGTAPILPPKDTTLPEFERANVDVWHYQDDYLQTVQLFNLNKDLKKNYLATYNWAEKSIIQLENKEMPNVIATSEGDGLYFYGLYTKGKRIASQWQGYTLQDVFVIDPLTGKQTLVKVNLKGNIYPSPSGNVVLMYHEPLKQYSTYHAPTKQVVNIARDISTPLYDVENDVPDDPNAYGIAKWLSNDSAVLIYDQFDVWQVSTNGNKPSIKLPFHYNTLLQGRTSKTVIRYWETDKDIKYIDTTSTYMFSAYSKQTKQTAFWSAIYSNNSFHVKNMIAPQEATTINTLVKAKNADVFAYTQESFTQSPNWFVQQNKLSPVQLSNTNTQQANYTWGTAHLYQWKAYDGKLAEGIVYKPENFDASKKYPMIVYFYERNDNTLYNYQSPAPTPSRLNIPFFVSRGYVVFAPNIWYTIGYPGKSAYNYIVSGTRALIKDGFIDSTKIGLQGQSWGGYQTAYLITQTNLYAAAWAGAPVTNMFSAYGGIRWESGLNRQFQYEHQQSRIGATIWQKPELYTQNSPQFYLPKVKTPLVIMHNDADGAVPWYQGIELFTGLRRLNKPVWLLNYNGEAHNLVERRNRKDIQIREQQFFDWLLKGEKPAPWLNEGVPAIMKGRTWGL